MHAFEQFVKGLTVEINGQYPRPWMTDLTNPLSARLFIVGKNQTTGYDVSRLNHERHMNALFNRHGESCRRVYDEMTDFSPSPTRQNTDRFRRVLENEGITQVLETNVVCYSTPMSSDLRLPQHHEGSVRGSEIFLTLLRFVQPKVLVAHGAGTRETLATLLRATLPPIPIRDDEPRPCVVGDKSIFIIPSLAPPQWYQWHGWAQQYLSKVAKAAASAL